MKKLFSIFLVVILIFSMTACDSQKNKGATEPITNPTTSMIEQEIEGIKISLSDERIMVDGQNISNDDTQAVYSANDIVFYLAGQDFTYGEGEKQDAHEQSEADAHTVVHITQPGRYILSGNLSQGQIAIDLGKEAKTDPEAVVTLILNNVDITCTVAPAIIFYNVYEPFNEVTEEVATKDVDTLAAGANVIIVDDTINNINGSYVAKIYKPDSVVLSEDGKSVEESKKLHKYDGAFYSKMTMNIDGGNKDNGVLNIKAENEGLDSEMHLTINGGIINITSGNDGINTNEDNISVTTVNGGTLNIVCDGSTGEGDGIDSNGWLVINGGTVTTQACSTSGDAGIDSDKGIYINGGKVMATGNMLDRIAGGNQTYIVLSFASRQDSNNYTIKNAHGEIVAEYVTTNSFTYLIVAGDEFAPGDYTIWQGETQLAGSKTEGMMGEMVGGNPDGERPNIPNGEHGAIPEMPEGMKRPDKQEGNFQPGQRPDMPNGEKPNDTPPKLPNGEMPEGMQQPNRPNGEFGNGEIPDGMTPPDFGGMMGGNTMQGGEVSTTFTITEGGNQFINVSPGK